MSGMSWESVGICWRGSWELCRRSPSVVTEHDSAPPLRLKSHEASRRNYDVMRSLCGFFFFFEIVEWWSGGVWIKKGFSIAGVCS